MSKHRKRPQAQKPRRSADHQREVLELRSSNAAQPHRNKKRYNRKDKHAGRSFDGME
jgi:hypothetical protein